ncbi:MAG: hypothetical protein K0R19_893 [Bacillota bacterium]|nr:hypothetical protein [Bacillota bacterium]
MVYNYTALPYTILIYPDWRTSFEGKKDSNFIHFKPHRL